MESVQTNILDSVQALMFEPTTAYYDLNRHLCISNPRWDNHLTYNFPVDYNAYLAECEMDSAVFTKVYIALVWAAVNKLIDNFYFRGNKLYIVDERCHAVKQIYLENYAPEIHMIFEDGLDMCIFAVTEEI